MNYRKSTQAEIDGYWHPSDADEWSIQSIVSAIVSRNVVEALKDAEKDSLLSLNISNWKALSDGSSAKPRMYISWLGPYHPSGRDVFNVEKKLVDAVDTMVEHHGPEYMHLVASEFEALARRIRRKIK